jgi:hypothetical protein
MTIFSKVLSSGLVLGCLVQTSLVVRAADNGGSGPLQFKFELNHPVVFAAVSTTRTTTDRTVQLETGAKTAVSTNLVEMRYKLRLTPIRQLADGAWTLHYEPFDFEEDLDTTANGGHVVTSIRGLDIKSTQNGIVVVDTLKGLGLTQAKAYKQAVYTRLLNGYFDFQPNGVIAKVSGDLPFEDLWTESTKYQVGFFDIVFSADPVPEGGSWNKVLALKDLEGIRLSEPGIMETNTFVRQNDAAATNHLVTVTVSMEVNPKNLQGNMDAMGQYTALNISEYQHQKSGKFLFDAEAGCLRKGDETETAKLMLDMLVQGHMMTVSTQLSIRSQFDLLSN